MTVQYKDRISYMNFLYLGFNDGGDTSLYQGCMMWNDTEVKVRGESVAKKVFGRSLCKGDIVECSINLPLRQVRFSLIGTDLDYNTNFYPSKLPVRAAVYCYSANDSVSIV